MEVDCGGNNIMYVWQDIVGDTRQDRCLGRIFWEIPDKIQHDGTGTSLQVLIF